MGASESKPDVPQSWKASGPYGISQDLIDSLRSSHETDASRARTIELKIQARVAEDLKKLQEKESEALKYAFEKVAQTASTPSGRDEHRKDSHVVGEEIEELRRKLEERRTIRPLPESVEGARSKVIKCLRDNDRRPLDCWQEVEDFKTEVRKLEMAWVDKAAS